MSNPNPTLSPSAATGAVGWSDERIEKMKALASEGYSASQIAKALGRVSRNGVLGKMHRLGLKMQEKPSAPGAKTAGRKVVSDKPRPKRRERTEAEERADGLRAPPVKRPTRGGKTSLNFRDAGSAPRPAKNDEGDPIVAGEPWVPLNRYDRAFQPLEGTQPRPFMQREPGQCRWPIDGPSSECLACGAHAGARNYCETHHRLAHPASARKSKGDDLIRAFGKVA